MPPRPISTNVIRLEVAIEVLGRQKYIAEERLKNKERICEKRLKYIQILQLELERADNRNAQFECQQGLPMYKRSSVFPFARNDGTNKPYYFG